MVSYIEYSKQKKHSYYPDLSNKSLEYLIRNLKANHNSILELSIYHFNRDIKKPTPYSNMTLPEISNYLLENFNHNNKYEFIIAIGTPEHYHDGYNLFLEKITLYIEKDGLLCLTFVRISTLYLLVYNFKKIFKFTQSKKNSDTFYYHMIREKFLKELFPKNQWTIVEYVIKGIRIQKLYFLLKLLLSKKTYFNIWIKEEPQSPLEKFLYRFLCYIFGSTMLVVCRKN